MNTKSPILEEKDGWVLVDFPAITAKEIIEDADNKTSTGTPILYNINWYKNESFYTTEKTREGKRWIQKEIGHKNKSWNECKELEKDGNEMLSFAEILYLLVEYEKHSKVRLFEAWGYIWTTSRVSDGRLVYVVGSFGADGAGVGGFHPGRADRLLGVSFSRSESLDIENRNFDPIERRLAALEEWRGRIEKISLI